MLKQLIINIKVIQRLVPNLNPDLVQDKGHKEHKKDQGQRKQKEDFRNIIIHHILILIQSLEAEQKNSSQCFVCKTKWTF